MSNGGLQWEIIRLERGDIHFYISTGCNLITNNATQLVFDCVFTTEEFEQFRPALKKHTLKDILNALYVSFETFDLVYANGIDPNVLNLTSRAFRDL